MCRFCEPKMPYGIEPLAAGRFLPDMTISANLAYITYGHYMLEIYCKYNRDGFKAKKAIPINYCPKCGRPLNFKGRKKA